jgi:hypothetical protein
MYGRPISLETLARWLRRLTILSFLYAAQLALMALLFFKDRIFLAVYAAASLYVSLMLRSASNAFSSDAQLAIAKVEKSFYLTAASAVVAFLYSCWTNPEFFASLGGVALISAIFVSMLGLFLFVKRLIGNAKDLASSSQNVRADDGAR